MSKRTLVYFIDGPNGCGKDFFIDNLVRKLHGLKLILEIRVLRATDFFVSKETISEFRKYTTYNTENSKSLSIYAGHVKLLETIAEHSREGVDVVLVNRSFLSMLSYNLYQPTQFRNRLFYLEQYTNILARYSEYYDIHFVNLCVDIKDLERRVAERNDGKVFDQVWTRQLIDNYARAGTDLYSRVPSIRVMNSACYPNICEEIQLLKEKENSTKVAEQFFNHQQPSA